MKGEQESGAQALSCHDKHETDTPDTAENRRLPFLGRREGVWLDRGSEIKRKAMSCLFGSLLTRNAQGAYLLRTPFESGLIEVEDVPFLAVELDWTGMGRMQRLSFRTNMDEVVVADSEHPIRTVWDIPPEACPEGCPPYLSVRAGEGAYPLEARLSRAVWYELAALAEPGACQGVPCMGVWSCGCFFPIARMAVDNGGA